MANPQLAQEAGPGVERPVVLQINELVVEFKTGHGAVAVVEDLSLALHSGETLGLVGESGSGKTTTGLAGL